jgi:hypothetical protein
MTNAAVAVVEPDVAAEARWRAWQARGAAADRRMTVRMRTLLIVLFAALAVAFITQLF